MNEINRATTPPTTRNSGFRFARIWIIAVREFRQTVFTKGFIFGAIFVPMLMFGVIGAVPLLISTKPVPVSGTIVVADVDGSAAKAMQKALDEIKAGKHAPAPGSLREAVDSTPTAGGYALAEFDGALPNVDVTVERVAIDSDLEPMRNQVQRGEKLALIEIPAELLSAAPSKEVEISLLVPSDSPAKTTRLFSRLACKATVVARVERSGSDFAAAQALLREPDIDTARLTASGEKAKEMLELRFLLPGGFMMLMWIAAFSSANQLLTTTIEEKSSKVIEVLLSATSPLELLAGKIVGQGLVSLLMLATWGSAGLAGLAFMTMLDIVPISTLLLFILWFFLAYFMSASIMAAVGSAVSDLREAQSLIQPAMMAFMIPLILWMPITENPTGWLATITSFIPPIGPFVMVLRTTGAVEPIPGWQIGTALVVNGAATVALVWLASRVFRIGVLMQGKPPTPMELLRWARTR